MPSLIVTSGPLTGQVFTFEDSAVIGRGQFCDIRINDGTVSRRHALVRLSGKQFELTDLGSANGSQRNEQAVTATVPLADGDQIKIGSVQLLFRRQVSDRPSLRLKAENADVATSPRPPVKAGRPTKTPARSTAGSELFRELLSRVKMFTDLGTKAHGEGPLRERLEAGLKALVAAFPSCEFAQVYAPAVAGQEMLLLASVKNAKRTLDQKSAAAIAAEATRHQLGLAVNDDEARAVLVSRLRLPELQKRLLALPLRGGGEVLGVLYLESSREDAWRASDQELFCGYAGCLAWMIGADRAQSPDRAVAAQDLALARRIQQRFLPQAPPQVAGYSIVDNYTAARVIGGDYYDFIDWKDARVGIVLADVSGKALSGALYMARLSVQVPQAGRQTNAPGALLAALGRQLFRELEAGMFVTMLVAALDPSSGRVELASAGHPAPLLRRADGRVENIALDAAPPLGAVLDGNYRERTLVLAPGDCLLLYTDGVDEAHNAKQELFGHARLVAAVKAATQATPCAVVESLLDQVGRFVGGEAPSDDLTVVCIGRDLAV